ncbi:GARP complex subunit Vps54 [Schizosaccharomyces japonicus yFS275]|uniref:GARP complex subunit Vps54 n=1 Tax=Schizosaccharomyces japonicus (strain yFS275 / FY16936) TaxID=402676 RepID=B6K5I9_SCHJY|nr:GARP complex subunit Vps54 [Schizosaccharomyces japonicus yFS275]EEB08793.1 GARP complex subunit Vps54 [Schizosaccharomyces japonicus yFS275]
MDARSLRKSSTSSIPSIRIPPKNDTSAALDTVLLPFQFRSILTDPINPHATTHVPARYEIEPVVLTPIPIIDEAEFQPYLDEIAHPYARYERHKKAQFHHYLAQQSRKRFTSSESDSVLTVEDDASTIRKGYTPSLLSQIHHQNRLPSEYSFSSSTLDVPHSGEGADVALMGNVDLEEKFPIDKIPTVFFQPDFSLDHPRTFDQVSEHAQVVPPEDVSNDGSNRPPRKFLMNNSMIQEKLSWYLDTVELHLLQEIEDASDSFPRIIDSLNDLRVRSKDCSEQAGKLKARLADRDIRLSECQSRISTFERKEKNLRCLVSCADDVQRLVELCRSASSNVENKAYRAALGSISDFEKMLRSKQAQGMDFTRLTVVRGYLQKIQNVKHILFQGLVHAFSEHLVLDLCTFSFANEKIVLVDQLLASYNQTSRQIPTVLEEASQFSPEFASTVEEYLTCLIQTGGLQAAVAIYKSNVFQEVKSMVKNQFPQAKRSVSSSSSLNESVSMPMTPVTPRDSKGEVVEPSGAALASALRALSTRDYFSLLRRVCAFTLLALKRLNFQVKFLVNFLTRHDAENSSAFMSLNDFTLVSAGVVLQRMVTLLSVREQVFLTYSLDEILGMYRLHSIFLSELEKLCGIVSNDFMAMTLKIVQRWYNNFQRIAIERIAKSLEVERWELVVVSKNDQHMADCLNALTSNKPVPELSEIDNPFNDAKTSGCEGDSKDEPRSYGCRLGSDTFSCVATSSKLLHVLVDYARFASQVPRFSSDCYASVLELYRVVNSRVYQLIMGAGAVRSAGLPRVLGKHIALAAQMIRFLQSSLKIMVQFLETTGGINPGLEVEKLNRDFSFHLQQVQNKFVALMREKANSCCRELGNINWTSTEPNNYIKSLTKGLVKVYNVLHTYSKLDEMIVVPEVINMFENRLQLELADAAESADNWPSIKTDLEYFYDTLTLKCGYPGERKLIEKFQRVNGQG